MINKWGNYRNDITNPNVLIEGMIYRVYKTTGTVTYNSVSYTNNSTFVAVVGKLTKNDVAITGDGTYQVDPSSVVYINNLYTLGDTKGDGSMLNPYKTIAKALSVGKLYIVLAGTHYYEYLFGYAFKIFGISKNIVITNTDLRWNPNSYIYNVTLRNCTLGQYYNGSQYVQIINCIVNNCYSYDSNGSNIIRNSLLINCTSVCTMNSTSTNPYYHAISNTYINCTVNLNITNTIGNSYQHACKWLIFDTCTITISNYGYLQYIGFKNCTITCGARAPITYDGTANKDYAKLQSEFYLAFQSTFDSGMPFSALEGCFVEGSNDNMFVDKTNGNYALKSTHTAAIRANGLPIGCYKVGTALKPTSQYTSGTNLTIASNSITLTSDASDGYGNSSIIDAGNLIQDLIFNTIGTEQALNGELFTEYIDMGDLISEGNNLVVGEFYQVEDNNDGVFAQIESNVASGNLSVGKVYVVRGTGSITYSGNGLTYTAGQVFECTLGALTYTESGSADVYEIIQYAPHWAFMAEYDHFHNYEGKTVQVREWLQTAQPRILQLKTSKTDATLSGESFHDFYYGLPCTVDGTGRGNAESDFDASTEEPLSCRYYQHRLKITVKNRKP